MLEFKFIYGQDGYEASENLRNEVFGNVSAATDERDGAAYHFIGNDKTVRIACARLLEITDFHFAADFVAVKKEYRHMYVGDLVMRALADKAAALGGTDIILESPTEIRGFFEFEGYEAFGEFFEKDGKEHIMMKKDLTKITPCRGCSK